MEQNWVSLNKNLQFVPPNAVIAGTHSNGSLVYVGRTSYRNEILTVKYIPDLKKAYIPFWVREREVKDIEVLCENDIRCRWVQGKPGSIPENAVMTGKVGKHEPIYVGRQAIDGHYTPGKIIKSKTLYLPYAGKEQKFKEFEVLVAEKKPNWFTANSAVWPEHAVVAGNDADGSLMYVCRSYHTGDLVPGKAIPSKNIAYISYGGLEYAKHEYEVLCHGTNLTWQHTAYNNIPPRAIRGGRTIHGENLYIGRAYHMNSCVPGKVQASHSTLYIPFGGHEITKQQYEILVEKD